MTYIKGLLALQVVLLLLCIWHRESAMESISVFLRNWCS